MAATNTNSIAMAFAGKTASVDIPKPRGNDLFTGRESFAAVAARSLPTKNPTTALPTPPNSISPSLPPLAFKSKGKVDKGDASPAHVDSDIDLHDAADHPAKDDVQPQHGFSIANLDTGPTATDTAGAITSGLLAKHHLPDILLAHGPLAIRHVMGYLTTSVPGFSRIPPAKARRLVVGALEGRGSGGDGGGVKGNVIFEKVGWGRWDARMKGHPPRESRTAQQSALLGGAVSPPPSVPSSYSALSPGSLPISNRTRRPAPGTSWAGDSAAFSHDEDMDHMYPEDVTMLEHEADKMSLDGDESCSSSEAPEDGPNVDEDIGDVTDEEDWANIGAAALRQGSLPASTRGRDYLSTHVHSRGRGGGPSSTTLAKSTPSSGLHNIQEMAALTGFSHTSGFGVGSDSQEREAIEALVRLSSV